MKKNNFIYYLITVIFALFAGLTFSSCDNSKDDELSEGLSIKVFTPTKIIAGQEVMITGSGLGDVTSVVFPGGVSTTNIEVISHNDIRVIAPAGIAAEGGQLVVHAGDQSVTARVPVTIGKPAVATLSPNDEASVGTELIITGSDMEFFKKAIFPGKDGEITVEAIDFIRKSTDLLRIKVPAGIEGGPARIRLVTCADEEILLPELKLVAMAVGETGPFEGEWVWYAGNPWGNGGYLASYEPAWWLVPLGELDQYGQAPGEGVAEASMVFEGPYMTKKRADGSEVTGMYTVDMTKTKTTGSGAVWAIGQLVTQDVTPLCGRWPSDDASYDIYTYDIIEFTDDRIVLAYAEDGTGEWGTAYFWVFVRKGSSSSTYPADLTLAEGEKITLEGIEDIADYWIDPDFLVKVDGTDNQFTFQAMAGTYRINADKTLKYFTFEALADGSPATLNEDGTGALWVIGSGIGKPTNDNNINWTESKALCMAPIGNKKYRITLVAGEQINTDAINFKFFHQKGWGGEFQNNTISTGSDLVFIGDGDDNGNVKLQSGVTLQNGTAYEFIVDVSGGTGNAVLTVNEK